MQLIAAISGSSLIGLFLQIIIAALVFWLLYWLLGYLKLPEPFNKIVTAVLAIAAVFFLINCLMSVGGHPIITW